MYTLYAMHGTCSMAVHVLLNELNQPVNVVDVSASTGAVNRPEFLKLNPVGQVPVLVDDGHAMTEGGAILSYLADKHQSPMMPKSGAPRATALQWLMFANATMHPAYARVFFIKRNLEDGEVKDKLMAVAVAKINELWAIVDARLASNPYICGAELTAADILLTVIANWTHNVPQPVTFGANVKRLLKEVSTRPAYIQALKAEGVEYKAAA